LPYPIWQYFFFIGTDFGWVCGSAGLTGVLLLFILIVMVLCSLPCVRRRGHFEVFYWTHMLFYFWYILLILHGADFWKWFVVPGLLYIVERVLRSKIFKYCQHGQMYIKEGFLLPSRVTHLVITHPESFKFQPGDYIFLQIPQIAKYEWHPFTISSAPEQEGFLWLHIRSVGTWTNKLYKFFEERNRKRRRSVIKMQLPKDQEQYQHTEELESAARALDDEDTDITLLSPIDIHPLAPRFGYQDYGSGNNPSGVSLGQDFSHLYSPPVIVDIPQEEEDEALKCYVDGPYGTPSAHIFQAEHAVLIGAGIGVTPFASILQSIMYRYQAAQQVCPKCSHSWVKDIAASGMKLRKVDFFWINRDQKSFEWFISLLSKLEIQQSEHGGFDRFLEMHMYMTSALSKTDMKAIGLQMALDLIHKKEKRDLITGLKTRTQAGRPDWDKVFEKLRQEARGKVTVFFCGSPALSQVLRNKCDQFGFSFRKENF
jgi:predicted ferric reductase